MFLSWLDQNWFDLLQTIGILGGLCVTAVTLRVDSRMRRVQNLLSITEQHRSIWLEVFDDPKLLRVLDENVDLVAQPVTHEERIFVNLIILHIEALFFALRKGVIAKPSGQDLDLQAFFKLPIPRQVWETTKALRDKMLVEYLDQLLQE